MKACVSQKHVVPQLSAGGPHVPRDPRAAEAALRGGPARGENALAAPSLKCATDAVNGGEENDLVLAGVAGDPSAAMSPGLAEGSQAAADAYPAAKGGGVGASDHGRDASAEICVSLGPKHEGHEELVGDGGRHPSEHAVASDPGPHALEAPKACSTVAEDPYPAAEHHLPGLAGGARLA